ncbi:MAG: hypothetical protein H6729_11455 [Deltaproteobacteria bacterium]|nr:hypothetical protein [Deltaproteobacteria bacterium]
METAPFVGRPARGTLTKVDTPENDSGAEGRAPFLLELYRGLDALADRTLPGRRPDGSALAARCIAGASFEIPKVASTAVGDTGDQVAEGHTGTTEDLPNGAILGAGSEDLAPDEAAPSFLPDFLTAPPASSASTPAPASPAPAPAPTSASAATAEKPQGLLNQSGGIRGIEAEASGRPPQAEPSLEELLFSDVSPEPRPRR